MNEQRQSREPAELGGDGAVPPSMAGVGGSLDGGLPDVRGPLRRLRGMLIRRTAAQEIGMVVAVALVALLVGGALDFGLRFPAALRVAALLVAVSALSWAIMRRVLPAVRFRPSLTSVALRVEGQAPEVRGALASAVDFQGTACGEDDLEQQLSRTVSARAAQSLEKVNLRSAIRSDLTRRRVGEGLLAMAAAAIVIVANPGMAVIGAQRLLLPWSGAEWPKRTGVVDITSVEVHPRGEALPVRALLTRAERGAERTEVAVQFRTVTDERAQASRREILALQGSEREHVLIGQETAEGHLFERLIEPEGDAIEYRFQTSDDATDWRRVRFVDPPMVRSATARFEPPAYAAAVLGTESEGIELGPGSDDRAMAPSALVGTRVTLDLELNKPAELPGLIEALRESDSGATVEQRADGDRYRIEFTLASDVRARIEAMDEFGIRSRDPAVFIFGATVDRPPAATMLVPSNDIDVLPSARVELVAEGRDDVALAFVSLQRETVVPAGEEPSGPGGALESAGPPMEVVRRGSAGTRHEELRAALDLSTFELVAGDEVHVTALASDILMESQGLPPVAAQSRIIRIISEQAFIDSLRGELAELRQASIRVDGQQGELQEKTAAKALINELRRGQGQVSERVARQRENVAAMRERVTQNRLNDAALEELLGDVAEALEAAEGSSAQAEQMLEGAQQAATAEGRDPEALTEDEAAGLGEEQREVREQLARVAEMLDRGEDAWVIQNTLNRLLRDQRELREATAAAGAAAAGQRPEDLPDDERQAIERLAEQQRQLAERTDEAVAELRERAAQLRSTDPATATGLQQAAASAQEQRVAQTMQQAASATEQNQTSTAQQAQDQAIEALEEVIEQLEAGERQREQVLRRLLASVIESLEALVVQQEEALTALEKAQGQEAAMRGLDAGMIRLNQNTLAVVDLLRGGGQELASVLGVVSRASDAQVAAVRALRSTPPVADAAQESEQRSLELLRDAVQRAKDAEQQLAEEEQERKERELKAAYTALLRQVTRLAEVTAEFALADELTRRDRAQLRELAGEHDAMVAQLDELEGEVAEIAQAAVFSHAHRRARALAEEGGAELREANADAALRSQRAMAKLLRNLVDSLGDPTPEDDPFSEGAQSGGSGGPGQGGGPPEMFPPPKELRLLRFMQVDLAARTAEADAMRPGEERQPLLDDVASEQRILSDLGKNVVQKLQGGGGGMPPMPMIPPDEGEPEMDEPAEENPAEATEAQEEGVGA